MYNVMIQMTFNYIYNYIYIYGMNQDLTHHPINLMLSRKSSNVKHATTGVVVDSV